ncbi:hypothetical protein LNQ52_22880 [Klebsiella pneumoniae subsp. pneumoniae]|nr:hypothetical protein [Klebsiella pneumoniae subsp. pneumoniae]
MALARPLACGLFACIGGAFLLLVHAFVVNDFTVRYVAENSNSALPVWYQGSGDLGRTRARCCCGFCCSASGPSPSPSSAAVSPLDAVARVLAVMGMIAFGFLLRLSSSPPIRSAAACRSTPLMAATSIRCCRISA